jgi:hypothetical protein
LSNIGNCRCLKFVSSHQVESDGSRSGSSLSLRTVLPSGGGGGVTSSSNAGGSATTGNNGTASHSPSHGTANTGRTSVGGAVVGNDGNHRGVQRSISASSSSKPRRGSTGAENNNAVICESTPASNQVVAQKPNLVAPTETEADSINLQGGTEIEKLLFFSCSN